MNKKDNVFVRLIKCIYDIKSYPKYIVDGVGKALLYAVLFTFIIGGVKGAVTTYEVNKSINQTVQTLKEDKYEFEIKNGTLELKSSPVKFDDNNALLYFDKEKTLQDVDDLKSLTVNADVYVLMLKDGVYLNSNSQSIPDGQSIKYSELLIDGNEKIDNEYIINLLNSLKSIIFFMIIIISIISTFIWYVVMSALIAVFSLLISRLLRLNLRFSHIFSLSMYTGTFPNVLITILFLFVPTVPLDTAAIIGTLLLNYVVLKNIRSTV